MKIDPNSPAFPLNEEITDRLDQGIKIYTGLTIRAELAARAMQGILSKGEAIMSSGETSYHPDNIATYALACADALIAEINKDQSL